MGQISGPTALTEYVLHLSKDKANKPLLILLVQGILAGIYIAIGAIASLIIGANTTDPGLGVFLGSFVFPVGIIAVLIMPAELYTSDCMVMTAIYARRTKIYRIFKILALIFLTNMVGGILMALLTNWSGIFSAEVMKYTIEKATTKAYMPARQLLVSSILCNIIVCTGVCLAYRCQKELSKIVVLWLSITVFAISGTEHVVANVYYLFTAYFSGAEIALSNIIYSLLLSGLGNFIGGGVIVSGLNYLMAHKDIEKNNRLY